MRQPSPEAAELAWWPTSATTPPTWPMKRSTSHGPTSPSRRTGGHQRDLMRRLPLIAAHRSDLPDPGNFVTRDVLGAPLPHRPRQRRLGRRLPEHVPSPRRVRRSPEVGIEAGVRVRLPRLGLRPRRRWSSQRAVRRDLRADRSRGQRPRRRPLRGASRLRGCSFSNDTSRRVADYLGPEVDARLDDLGLDGSVVFMDNTVELDVNWKLVMDSAPMTCCTRSSFIPRASASSSRPTSPRRRCGHHDILHRPQAARSSGEVGRAGRSRLEVHRHQPGALPQLHGDRGTGPASSSGRCGPPPRRPASPPRTSAS